MTPVTLWFRHVKVDGELTSEFNHLEDGHCENDVPTPKHESHKRVWSGVWTKQFASLTNAVPPVVVGVH